jgi:hypothetical protein
VPEPFELGFLVVTRTFGVDVTAGDTTVGFVTDGLVVS